MPWFGIETEGTYKGSASTLPSTESVKSFPKLVEFTFAGVRIVSWRFWPVLKLSLCHVKTLACPCSERQETEIVQSAAANGNTRRMVKLFVNGPPLHSVKHRSFLETPQSDELLRPPIRWVFRAPLSGSKITGNVKN